MHCNRRQRELTAAAKKRLAGQVKGGEERDDGEIDTPEGKSDDKAKTSKKTKKKLTRRRLLRKARADIFEILRLDEG